MKMKRMIAAAALSLSFFGSVLAAPPCDLKCFELLNACLGAGNDSGYCYDLHTQCIQDNCPAP